MKAKITNIDPNIKEFLLVKCPSCRSCELLKIDTDIICLDCDWSSSFMEVASGNFEKRLAILLNKELQEKAIRSKTKILHIPTEVDQSQQLMPRAASE